MKKFLVMLVMCGFLLGGMTIVGCGDDKPAKPAAETPEQKKKKEDDAAAKKKMEDDKKGKP